MLNIDVMRKFKSLLAHHILKDSEESIVEQFGIPHAFFKLDSPLLYSSHLKHVIDNRKQYPT